LSEPPSDFNSASGYDETGHHFPTTTTAAAATAAAETTTTKNGRWSKSEVDLAYGLPFHRAPMSGINDNSIRPKRHD